ncbi:hypothetical protein SPRG_07037 [Saprolegnia parasitica CBS 223.65]|uniref:60S ribosomal protein L6 n=1 Tax=Saprolegnia parasitica (strain CBS 223.65) TaxID=695850 RepID=A0A067C9J5_SAPPC|nr:hypothetical protein SPRG_07037 [Saprolegnia parasitica CBS 223.65]KDO27449.1 hypothetical protein SPRG_07037 [Saprolegnia parasitica CBS 223.65]|eukprot:XP_012201888.1 hypothetical protein SPRG_07037 [Saprolegnia parasitica CBS 223.65]
MAPAKTAAKKPAAKKTVARRQNVVLARRPKASQKKAVVTKTLRKPKWYPTDYVPKPLPSAKTARNSVKTAKLRASITPGTVLILLSGRFRGKRVVFLKQLASGTLLVTGPYKVNGVPLRRVNQAFVIATSTKVDISDVKLPEINDAYFAREKTSSKKDEEAFFAQASTAAIVSEQRKKDQKIVDAALLKKIAAVPALKHYLNAKFSLTKNDRVHELKF